MIRKKNIVAIIPARGGSKGMIKKNIKLLAGKPLIAYTIEAAKQCLLIDRVIVSTDDEEILKIAKEYGAQVPFLRPKDLAQDDTPTEPVLKHAIEWLEKNENYTIDIVVFLQPTDIFRKKWMLQKVVETLLNDDLLDSVFIATKTHKNYWRKIENRWVCLTQDIAYGPRQKREPIYREDTGLACATRAKFIKEGRRIGDNIQIVINDSDLPFVDIHDERDLWLVEKIITELGIRPND